jgi:hypothetical protein
MKNGKVLFGDNAYLNTDYMATPYTNVSGNPEYATKDDYNFYHSQLRIRVECCFGMLVQHWGRLRMSLHHSLTISCIVALVNCLASLHNFCFAETKRLHYHKTLGQRLSTDAQHMMESRNGYVILWRTENNEVIPSDLLSTNVPFVDVPSTSIRNHKRNNPETGLPRFRLHNYIAENHYQRPRKIGKK